MFPNTIIVSLGTKKNTEGQHVAVTSEPVKVTATFSAIFQSSKFHKKVFNSCCHLGWLQSDSMIVIIGT